MSTFELKILVIQSLGNSYTPENAEKAYQWLLSEVEVTEPDKSEASVTHLTPVN